MSRQSACCARRTMKTTEDSIISWMRWPHVQGTRDRVRPLCPQLQQEQNVLCTWSCQNSPRLKPVTAAPLKALGTLKVCVLCVPYQSPRATSSQQLLPGKTERFKALGAMCCFMIFFAGGKFSFLCFTWNTTRNAFGNVLLQPGCGRTSNLTMWWIG